MTEDALGPLGCDLLILVATPTEEQQLKTVARELGLAFQPRNAGGLVGEYFRSAEWEILLSMLSEARWGLSAIEALLLVAFCASKPPVQRHSCSWAWRSGLIEFIKRSVMFLYQPPFFHMTTAMSEPRMTITRLITSE